MMRSRTLFRIPVFLALLAVTAPTVMAEGTVAAGGSSIKQAAAFYHQGRYDSALASLETLKGMGPWKRRDSLSFFQYLGMASARLGREAEAAGYFQGLLGLDSLFQFPRNEDPLVVKAFQRARDDRQARSALPPSGNLPSNPRADTGKAGTSGLDSGRSAGKFSMADSGRASGPLSSGNGKENSPGIGLAMGAIPLGGGWLARRKPMHGMTLGLLQAGGLVLSIYASARVSREERDWDGVRDDDQHATVEGWQWVQRVSLSTALGAYLFSLIASAGD